MITQPALSLILPPFQPPIPPTLNPIDPPPTDHVGIQEDERFYDTEINEELELPSTSQISGTKEFQDNPPGGKINSKRLERPTPQQ